MQPDRAERQLFAALPELDAAPRRGLALTLAGVPRAGIASELGLSGAALSAQLATGRKALRRTRVELASAGRCERAERALSDRLDGVLSATDERFLDAHLVRCTRCRTHEAELTAALEELRAGFEAPGPPQRAQLRVVPPAPQLPPAPEPPAEARVTQGSDPSVTRDPVTRLDRIRAALPVAVAVLIAIGLVAAAIALLSALGNNDSSVRAPWDAPNAPVVHPAPISGE